MDAGPLTPRRIPNQFGAQKHQIYKYVGFSVPNFGAGTPRVRLPLESEHPSSEILDLCLSPHKLGFAFQVLFMYIQFSN